MDIQRLVNSVWIVIATYWAIEALRAKPVRKRQGYASRVLHTVIAGAAVVLIWKNATAIGFLGYSFVPHARWIQWLGLALTISGCAFAIWARACLGSNWSSSVTVKRDHELIRRGPYAMVRHPIYSGLFFALAGTAITVGEIRALLGLVLAFLYFFLKSGLEEQFMREEFDGEYVQYAQHVRRLIPLIL